MKIVKNQTPDDLAKEQLNKIELSQSFILAINYGGRIEVITKADLFQGCGLLEVARTQVLKSLQIDLRQN